MLVIDFKAKRHYAPYDGIMSGMFAIVVGIVLTAIPKAASVAFAFVIGIWIAIVSVNTIKLAIVAKKESLSWVSFFCYSTFST